MECLVPVLLGMLLMVLVFLLNFLISKAAGKDKLDAFMTKVQLSIKRVKLMKLLFCDKQQGSVANNQICFSEIPSS
jgi:biopolymer transport protein ExbB